MEERQKQQRDKHVVQYKYSRSYTLNESLNSGLYLVTLRRRMLQRPGQAVPSKPAVLGFVSAAGKDESPKARGYDMRGDMRGDVI